VRKKVELLGRPVREAGRLLVVSLQGGRLLSEGGWLLREGRPLRRGLPEV
jgi:hypothetical protein